MAIKIYTLPPQVPAPKVDYSNYDHAKVDAAEKAHMAKLADWLRSYGFTGKHTGAIYSTPVADGYAQYMIADAPGKNFGLVHLPYGDAYQSRDVGFLTKTEILRRMEADKKFRALFDK